MIISAGTGHAVSRMRFPGHRRFIRVLPVTRMFPVAALMAPMYQRVSEPQLIDGYLGLILVYRTTTVLAVGLQACVSAHDAQRNPTAVTAVLIAIPVSAFFRFVQKNLVTGLTAGSTKG